MAVYVTKMCFFFFTIEVFFLFAYVGRSVVVVNYDACCLLTNAYINFNRKYIKNKMILDI